MPRPKKEEFVTKEAFDGFQKSIEGSILQLIELQKPKPEVPTTKVEKEFNTANGPTVIEARANFQAQVPPEWEDVAREMIGDKLDHCEVKYPKEGGIEFTVVIKNEHSTAGKEYLERMKVDRRTASVGSTGLDGVKHWCKLVSQNLNKQK